MHKKLKILQGISSEDSTVPYADFPHLIYAIILRRCAF